MIAQKPILTIVTLGLMSVGALATPANFRVEATFKRNPKIWGTYRLDSERVTIKRGKETWRTRPPKRIGDMVISDGHLVFVRENNERGQTKIVVDKIPYAKKGKKVFHSQKDLDHKEQLARLYESDLKKLIPHRDLLEGEVDYKGVRCHRKKYARIVCTIEGLFKPAN